MISPSGSPCKVYRNKSIEMLLQSERNRRYAAAHPVLESPLSSLLSMSLATLSEFLTVTRSLIATDDIGSLLAVLTVKQLKKKREKQR